MNANVNFCGVIILLRKLVELGHCTKKEANRIDTIKSNVDSYLRPTASKDRESRQNSEIE